MGLPQVSIAGIEIRHSIKQGASQGLRSLFIETYDDLDRRGRHHEVSELSSLSSASSEAEWSSSARERNQRHRNCHDMSWAPREISRTAPRRSASAPVRSPLGI